MVEALEDFSGNVGLKSVLGIGRLSFDDGGSAYHGGGSGCGFY